jgi:hypothetical protein
MRTFGKDDGAYVADEVDEILGGIDAFEEIIDPATWKEPEDYFRDMPQGMRAAVTDVVESDEHLRRELRESWLREWERDGTLLAWESVDRRYLDLIRQKRLYAGRVQAADATLAKYETLSLVGAQIAVSRVGYQGSSGHFVSNITHWGKELPRNVTPAALKEALRSRGKELSAKLPNVFVYAIALYKERQVLLDTPPGTFKILHGTVFPHELLTGSGTQFIMDSCLGIIGDLIDDGDYVSVVSSDSHRNLLTLGLALDAGEYIVGHTCADELAAFFANAHYTRTPVPKYGYRSQRQLFEEFRDRYAHRVVQGVLKAHPLSPPYIFYANADRVQDAVHVLMADSCNTSRGFPMLIDYADQHCSGMFKASEYANRLQVEFARASGGSGMYQSERSTRG